MANGIVSAQNCRASRARVAPRDAPEREFLDRLVALAEEEIRQVDADRQKQNSDRCEQQEECVANGACHVIEQGLDEHAGTAIGLRILTRQACRQHAHVSASLRERRASLQACHTQVAVVTTFSQLIGWNVERRPEFELTVGILEVGAHHSDNLIWRAIQQNRAPDHGRVAAEPPLPQAVTQHGDARCPAGVELLLLGVDATDHRSHPQGRKDARGRPRALEPFGLTTSGQVVIGDRARETQILKHLLLVAPVEVVRGAGVGRLKADRSACGTQRHQSIGLLVGEIAKENTVDDREDYGDGSNAEGQQEDAGTRKHRVPPKLTNPVPDILDRGLEGRGAPCLAGVLLDAFESTESKTCLSSRVLT